MPDLAGFGLADAARNCNSRRMKAPQAHRPPVTHSRQLALQRPAVGKRFLAALINSGNVSYAATEAGTGLRTAYDYRNRFPRFAAEWEAALDANEDLRWRTGGERWRFRVPTAEDLRPPGGSGVRRLARDPENSHALARRGIYCVAKALVTLGDFAISP